jgi:hypothetical protein
MSPIAGGAQAVNGASGYSTHVLPGAAMLQHTLGCACPSGQGGTTAPASTLTLTGCEVGNENGITGGGAMTVAREKHSLVPAPFVAQHTSNCPPRGTCQLAGQDPPLQSAGPPCEVMISEQATPVTCTGLDPISENRP